MRTLTELYTIGGRIYLFVRAKSYDHFAAVAKNEGFRLPKSTDDIFSLQPDFSFCHTGWAGHMAFHANGSSENNSIKRIDYVKWISGAEDYLYHKDE